MRVSEIIGDNLHALRRAAGLTQAELADAMSEIGFGWQRQTVAETEAGRRDISVEELVAIAAFFEMPLSALLIAPGSALAIPDGIDVGGRSLQVQHWVNLIDQRRGPLEPAHPRTRNAIDALVGTLPRPWAKRWRRSGNGPSAFTAAREQGLRQRSRFPGPIFLWEGEGDLERATTIPPWGASVRITLKPGIPYVARDEMEAEDLLKTIKEHRHLKLRVITRQEAYRLRQRKES